jgi:hypothetical protein
MLRSLHRCVQRAESRLVHSLAYSSRYPLVTRPLSFRPTIQSSQSQIVSRPFSISIPRLQSAQAVNHVSSPETESEWPQFEDLRGKLDNVLVDTITQNLGLKTMTEVQARTLDACLKGIDVFVLSDLPLRQLTS